MLKTKRINYISIYTFQKTFGQG